MFTSFLTKISSQWVLFSRVSYFLKLKQKCRWKRGEDHLNIWRLISGEIKSFVVRTRPSQSPLYTSYDHVRLSASSTVIGAIPFLRLLTDSSHFSLALIHLWLVMGRRNELLLHETARYWQGFHLVTSAPVQLRLRTSVVQIRWDWTNVVWIEKLTHSL